MKKPPSGPWECLGRKTRAGLIAFLALGLLSSSLQAQSKARAFYLNMEGGRVRVLIPIKFAPLLPGSVYPNRAKPIKAEKCPVAIVEKLPDFTKGFEEPLLDRGFLVVEIPRRWLVSTTALLQALARHPEADPARTILIVWQSLPPRLDRRVGAAAIFDPDFSRGIPQGGEGRPAVATFFLTPRRAPSEELTWKLHELFGAGVVEKWYRSPHKFPPEAFRDAAEWLHESLLEQMTAAGTPDRVY